MEPVVGYNATWGCTLADGPPSGDETAFPLGIVMFHYTDKVGWKSIRSQVTWCFRASKPKSHDRPIGAYFTDIEPTTANLRLLHQRLRIPAEKREFVFSFRGDEGLTQLNGGTGRDKRIFYSPGDYRVTDSRQLFEGSTGDWPGRKQE